MKTKYILSALCALPLLGSAEILAVRHDMYGGNVDAWQMKRHAEKMNVVTNGGAKVVFIGDSITHFWESHGKAQLAKYFSEGDAKMLDLGISADRTEHVLWRLNEGGELDGYEAKCILLMIGTNNTGHRTFAAEPPSDTILGIREIVKTIRAKQPSATLVLTSVFPRGFDTNDALRRRNAIVNKEIQKFADGQTIFWCDFSDQYLTADGRLTRELFPDLLHPNAAGYEIWYAAVKPYVDYALSDGKLPRPANRYASHVDPTAYQMDEKTSTYPVTRIRSEGYGAYDWWLDRLFRNRNEISDANGAIDVVLLGDSITHNWENSGKAALEEFRQTYSVLDAGYSGDRTEHLLWRVRNGELDGYTAKAIVLMIGTNNTWHRYDKAADTAEGIRLILDTIAAKQPQAKVILLPIFPIGDGPTEKRRVRNTEVNEIIKGYADGEKVIWYDFSEKFLDEKGDTQWIMPDRVHPNAEGYQKIWLPALRPLLKEICGK